MTERICKGKRRNGEWVMGIHIVSPGGVHYIYKQGEYFKEFQPSDTDERFCLQLDAYKVDTETVCEYTGIDDRYGERIFEHDIIRFMPNIKFVNDMPFRARYPYTYDSVVVFYESKFCAVGVQKPWELVTEEYDLEVIGNYYDDAEKWHENLITDGTPHLQNPK